MTFNLTKKDLYIMGIVNFTPDSLGIEMNF